MIEINSILLTPNPVLTGATVLVEVNATDPHTWELLQKQTWDTPGTYSFTVPDTGTYEVIVYGGGGGAGGGALYKQALIAVASGGGGGSSGTLRTVKLNKDDVISVTVGASGRNGTSGANTGSNGTDGSASSFGNISVNGGAYGTGGIASPISSARAGVGGVARGNIGDAGFNGQVVADSDPKKTTADTAKGGAGFLGTRGGGGYSDKVTGSGGSGSISPQNGVVQVTLLAYGDSFAEIVPATVSGQGDASNCYAVINGQKYSSFGSSTVHAGDTVTAGIYNGKVYVNGAKVYSSTNAGTYNWTVPSGTSTVYVVLRHDSNSSNVYITTA